MTEHRITDETATLIVLNSVVRDMKHALEWVAVGLLGLCLFDLLQTIDDAVDGQWILCGFHLFLAAYWGAMSLGTYRRARKYRAGAKR